MTNKRVGYVELLRWKNAQDDTICAREINESMKQDAAATTLRRSILDPVSSKSAKSGATQILCTWGDSSAGRAHDGNGMLGVLADRLPRRLASGVDARQPLFAGLGLPDICLSDCTVSEHALEKSILEFLQTSKLSTDLPLLHHSFGVQRDKNETNHAERLADIAPTYSGHANGLDFPDLLSEICARTVQHVLAIEQRIALTAEAHVQADDAGLSVSLKTGPAEVVVPFLKQTEQEFHDHVLADLQEDLAKVDEPTSNGAEMASLLIFSAAMIPGWQLPVTVEVTKSLRQRDYFNGSENFYEQQMADYMTYLANSGANTALMERLSARTQNITWESTLLQWLLSIVYTFETVFHVLKSETAALQACISEEGYRGRLMPFKTVSRSRVFLD